MRSNRAALWPSFHRNSQEIRLLFSQFDFAAAGNKSEFRRLPFDHCALSFQPFENPLCNHDGVIYDFTSIYPFTKKYGIDPATGKVINYWRIDRCCRGCCRGCCCCCCCYCYNIFPPHSQCREVRKNGNCFQKLDSKALIKLKFTKNADGKYHCPVLFKVFNENSHIVAIKTTGNVFSYEAVEQLNLKTKNFKVSLIDPVTEQNNTTL